MVLNGLIMAINGLDIDADLKRMAAVKLILNVLKLLVIDGELMVK